MQDIQDSLSKAMTLHLALTVVRALAMLVKG